MNLYFNNDLSLTEIAEELKISRQGAHDSIKKAKTILFEYEEKLGLLNRFILHEKRLKKVLKNLNSIDIKELNQDNNQKINSIKNDLEKLVKEI